MVLLPQVAASATTAYSLPPWLDLTTGLSINAGLAAISAALTVFLCRRWNHRDWRFKEGLTLWVLATCIPAIGPFCLLPAIIRFCRLGKDGPSPIPSHLEVPAYAPEISAQFTRFSAGGAVKRLSAGQDDGKKAVLALMALDQSNAPADTKILQHTLSHQNDYLRLLAFSMLERREKRLTDLIHMIHKKLDSNPEPNRLARFHKELAYLHWELLYQALSQDDLQRYHLEQASFHLQLALELLPEDTGLWILQSRMALRAEAYDAADQALKHAHHLNAPATRIMAYAAEYAFIERQFEQIPYYLQEAPALEWLSTLKPIYRLWKRAGVY